MQNTEKKSAAPNTQQIFVSLIFLVCFPVGIWAMTQSATAMAVIFMIFCLMALLVFCSSPLYYVFGENEIVIMYPFKVREKITKEAIEDITVHTGWKEGMFPYYKVTYHTDRKRNSYMNGEIARTRATRKLLCRFWGRDI